MNIAEFSIQKKTITLVIAVLILVGGLSSYQNLGRLEDPEFTIKSAVVVTSYPGATPMETAEEVTDPIETEIQQLPQLKWITSRSNAGLSVITIEIKDKYGKDDLPQVWDELRRKVHDIQSKLPPGTLPSIVNDSFGDVYGILLAVTGEGYTYRELREYVEFLRRELLLVEDVAKIELWGLQEEAIFVEISRFKMAQLGIGPNSIYQALKEQNLVAPAGSVQVGPEYIRICPTGSIESVEDIANLQIRDPLSDRVIYLKDVAEVIRGYMTPPQRILRFNGKPSISIGVSVVSGGNVVTMGEAVKKRLTELQAETPVGMELGVVNFQSDDVIQAVDSFIINFIEAIAIVIVVLLIFMGVRSGLLIGVILALTVLASFIVMNLLAIDLQRISLGALIIALGMLVDNAIVVTDGMLIRIQQGMNRLKAAKDIVAQNQMPLLGATVIAILAFAAIGLSQDNTGEYCRSLFQVMLISLSLSWIVAITITPLFCTMFLKVEKSEENAEERDPYRGVVYVAYKQFLRLCIHRRWLTVLVMAGLLVLAVYGFGQLKNSFFPSSTRSQFQINFWLPAGTDIRNTTADIAEIEKRLLADDRIVSTASYIGAGASRFMLTFAPETSMPSSFGLILVTVKDYRDIKQMIPELNRYLAENYPDSEPVVLEFVLGPGGGYDIEARFSGPDPATLRRLSHQAQEVMRTDSDAVAIRDDWRQRVKIIQPVYDETKGRIAGVTRTDLNNALEMAFTGSRIGIYREGNKLWPIIARPPELERVDAGNIEELQIWSPIIRKSVPVRQVVSEFKTTWEDSRINRRNRKLTITAQCNARFGVLASQVFDNVRQRIEAIDLPPGYEMEWGGQFENSKNAKAGLASTIPATVLLMVLIVIILFNALRQPLIIWLTVPLTIVGVTIGLLIFNLPFDFMAILGFLSLVGMQIKGAIVLIDQIGIEMRSGKAPYQAVTDAAISRLRPVCMAAITTVLGMIPLLQDPFFISMAVTIMFGLSFATILTLIVVPTMYSLFFNVKEEN